MFAYPPKRVAYQHLKVSFTFKHISLHSCLGERLIKCIDLSHNPEARFSGARPASNYRSQLCYDAQVLGSDGI
jgi:hypothetical protein